MSASWSWKSSGDTAVVRKTDDGITPSSGGGGGGATLPILLESQVSGVLPIANGGTGVSTTSSYSRRGW